MRETWDRGYTYLHKSEKKEKLRKKGKQSIQILGKRRTSNF